jgi:hypothetical protein
MGCDEHLYIEAFVDGAWRPIDPPKPIDTEREEDDSDPIPSWNFGRSYRAYARLAGVRNYNEVAPIAPDRGLPSDMSAPVRTCYENMEPDAHSATWFTLPEIEGEQDRIEELAAEMRRVAMERGVPPEHVRAVVWFDN